MPRAARIVVPGVPHHVVQRGNRRQATFFCADDYAAYLEIAAKTFAEARVEVWAYCLMPNHVHLIATPADQTGLAAAVGATHLQYTRMINRREGWSGYLWQGRFSSFPMDDDYLVSCVRYVGANPVRSRLVKSAAEWRWSSVRSHVFGAPDPLLSGRDVIERLGFSVDHFFDEDAPETDINAFRRSAANGRPVGGLDWIRRLEMDR